MKDIVRKIIFVVCVIVLLYSLYNILFYSYENKTLKDKNDFVQDMIHIDNHENIGGIKIPTDKNNNLTPDINVDIPMPTEPDIYKDLKIDIKVDWEKMHASAKDLVGWIFIPDTNINFPVLHHKTDTQYYLHRDYEGKWNSGGSIFLNKDTDINSKNVLIYGHNMKSDIMFHRLRYYKEQEFADQHQYIYIVTESETRIYQIFSVVITPYWSDSYTYEFDLPENMSFMDYIEQEKGKSIINTETRDITEDDKIITLSTCSGGAKTERMLVHAVLITSY